jgi:hypothetical protein
VRVEVMTSPWRTADEVAGGAAENRAERGDERAAGLCPPEHRDEGPGSRDGHQQEEREPHGCRAAPSARTCAVLRT